MSQAPRSTSTLELVVNEQQLQNMSQVDLSRPEDRNNTNQTDPNRLSTDGELRFSFSQLKRWPARFRESFNAKLDEAKSKSETKAQFVFEILHAFSGIVIWFLCFVGTILLPVILFFIGLSNLDSCQDRPSLPYLIFSTGFVMTASNLFNLALALDLPILTNHSILSSDVKNIIASIVNIIFNCVVAFLYIISAYMVFTIGGAKKANSDSISDDIESEPMNCNETLYSFTFWFVALTLGLFLTLCLMACILFVYNKYRLAIIRGSTPRSQTNPSTNPTPNIYATNRV